MGIPDISRSTARRFAVAVTVCGLAASAVLFAEPGWSGQRSRTGIGRQGQPTHFQTGRQWGAFAVKIPKDFGTKAITWTITSNGETQSIPFLMSAEDFDHGIADLVRAAAPDGVFCYTFFKGRAVKRA